MSIYQSISICNALHPHSTHSRPHHHQHQVRPGKISISISISIFAACHGVAWRETTKKTGLWESYITIIETLLLLLALESSAVDFCPYIVLIVSSRWKVTPITCAMGPSSQKQAQNNNNIDKSVTLN